MLELIRKGVRWKWTEVHQKAFQRIKDLFVEVITLAHPDPDRPYIVTTDASDYAVGAALSQLNDRGEEEVITFISRTLKGAEIRYFTTEKELLAIIWALKKFSTYLRGARTIIRTDHQALTFMHTCKFTNNRITRWILSIQDYDIEVEHIKGSQNIVADVLSRQSINGQRSRKPIDEIIIASLLAQDPSSELREMFRHIPEMQEKDANISRIRKHIERINKHNQSRGSSTFVINNEQVYRCDGTLHRLMLPRCIATRLATETHEAYGHIGARKVAKMLAENFVCKGLSHIIGQAVSVCDSCQRNKYSNRGSAAPMQNIIPEKPGDLLSIDFYGPLPVARGGVKYILVTIDAFSKYVVLYAIKKANSATVINKIFGNYIPNYGKPRRIQCDHGTQFTGVQWAKKLEEENVKLVFSSIRHPQGNIVERVNRELGRFFRTFVGNQHTNWPKFIPIIHTCINETMHESTEFTPIELHFNRQPERMWKNWISLEYVNQHPTHEEKIYLTRERLKKKGERRAERCNKNKTFTELNLGDEVLVKANNVSDSQANQIAKFFAIYEGPYIVTRKVGEATYVISNNKGKERGRFHVSNMKRYKRMTTTTSATITSTTTARLSDPPKKTDLQIDRIGEVYDVNIQR